MDFGVTLGRMSHAAASSILEQHHRDIDAALERLGASLDAKAPDGAALVEAASLLRGHIHVEERHVFPALAGGQLAAALFVMVKEHAKLWALLARLEAGPTPETLMALTALLARHNAKEEPVIYPHVDEVVSAASLGQPRAPAGWAPALADGGGGKDAIFPPGFEPPYQGP